MILFVARLSLNYFKDISTIKCRIVITMMILTRSVRITPHPCISVLIMTVRCIRRRHSISVSNWNIRNIKRYPGNMQYIVKRFLLGFFPNDFMIEVNS